MDPLLLQEFCDEYTAHRNKELGGRNAALTRAKAELEKLAREKAKLIQAIKDGVPGAEVKEDFIRIATRREELESFLNGRKEEPVLLHPNMADLYRRQVANLASALNEDETRTEAAEIIRSLIDRITLTPNCEGKLDIDLYGDLAGILTVTANKEEPLQKSDPSVVQVNVVAGARSQLHRLFSARGLLGD
jgi:site-specific DNA recombinase